MISAFYKQLYLTTLILGLAMALRVVTVGCVLHNGYNMLIQQPGWAGQRRHISSTNNIHINTPRVGVDWVRMFGDAGPL